MEEYCTVPVVHTITLGDIVKLIKSFRQMSDTLVSNFFIRSCPAKDGILYGTSVGTINPGRKAVFFRLFLTSKRPCTPCTMAFY